MNVNEADLERMTDSNHHLGTDADGNDHYAAKGGIVWIADDGAIRFSQTVPSLEQYIARVRDVTGWDEVDEVSDQPFGAWLCDHVEATSEEIDRGEGVATDGGVVMGSALQHAVGRENRLYEDPIGPEPARTVDEDDCLSFYEAADLSVGDSIVWTSDEDGDEFGGDTDEVIAIFENRQPGAPHTMVGDLVHCRRPDGETYVQDAYGLGGDLITGHVEVRA